MYWIYLALFVAIVLVPEVISGDRFFLREDDQESLLIFFVGATGLLLYLWKENQLRFHMRERTRLQKETTRISRDLADSYSYIAEINRKMEILKNIALGLPETASFTPEKIREVYESILSALSVLGKTETYFLVIVEARSGTVEKSFSSGKKEQPSIGYASLLRRSELIVREGDYVVIRSPRRVKGRAAFVLLRKRNDDIEDPEIFKALAAQALFLATLERERLSEKSAE